MTDRPFDTATVHADDELVFDDDADPAPPPPPRKAPRKGRAAATTETGSVTVPEPVAEEPADAPAQIPPRDEPPAGSEHPPRRDTARILMAAIVAFAFLTSLIALGATIAIGRTLAATRADRAQAAEAAQATARIPALVGALDAAVARIDRAPVATPVPPATAADVHAAIDDLRGALGRRAPEGMTPIAGTLREGFSRLDTRLSRIEDRLDAPRR